MRRTSSRRSIPSHPGQNDRRTNISENPKVRMSRYLDTSTEKQMANIMVQHGRPSRSPWAKSVRSFSDRTIMGKAIRESSIEKYGWEKVPNWECLFVNREKGLLLSVYVDDIKLAGKKQNISPTWKILMKDVDFGRTNIIPRPCFFVLHSKRMWD